MTGGSCFRCSRENIFVQETFALKKAHKIASAFLVRRAMARACRQGLRRDVSVERERVGVRGREGLRWVSGGWKESFRIVSALQPERASE